MRSKAVRIAFILLVSAGIAGNAQADVTNPSINVGAMLGLAIPSTSGTSSRFTWGVEGDFHVLPKLTLGAYYLTSSQDNSIPPITSSAGLHLYGLQGAYKIDSVPGLAIGARLGMVNSSIEVSGGGTPGSSSTTDFSVGPAATYDFQVSNQFTVGGDASILFVTAANSFNIINLLGTFKYWF